MLSGKIDAYLCIQRWPLSQINPIFQFSTKFRETNRPNNRKISQLTPAWYLKREYFKLFFYLSVCDIYNVYELLIAIKQISWIYGFFRKHHWYVTLTLKSKMIYVRNFLLPTCIKMWEKGIRNWVYNLTYFVTKFHFFQPWAEQKVVLRVLE